jgi:hypothetical protein
MGPISCSSPFCLLEPYQAFPPRVVTAITKAVAYAIAHNLRAAGFSGYFSASSDDRRKSALPTWRTVVRVAHWWGLNLELGLAGVMG